MIIKFYKQLLIRLVFMPVKDIFGGGDDSGKDAANAQVQANQASIDEMKRQFGITQKNIAPFLKAGQGAVAGVEAGTTVSGLDALLQQIFGSDTFGSLVDERTRAVEGQLAAGGLTRSGTALQEAARVPTDIGLMLEQMLNGRQNNLMNTGLNAAVGLGNIGQTNSSGIASLLSQSGNAVSSGIITDAQAKAQGQQNLLNTAATIGSMFMGFSDPRLKINAEVVSDIKGILDVWQWDWVPETKGTLVEGCANMGFMSSQVKKVYPQHVYSFGGFDIVDYPSVLDELEAA